MNANENEGTQVPSTPAAAAEAKAKPAAKAKKAAVKKPAAKAKKRGAPNKGAKAGKGIAAAKGPAVLREYAEGYVKDTEHKTPSGNPSVHCDDPVAKKLLGKSLEDVYALAAKTIGDETVKDLQKKYGHLNPGMQRMNLGNRMRGVLNAK